MRIYFSENEAILPYTKTLLRQVISAGIRACFPYKNVHSPAGTCTRLAYTQKYNCEINLSFVSTDEIRQLNKQFRGIDKPTDVLSFPSPITEPQKPEKRKKPTLALGDIIICHPVAEAQAREYGHSLERELAFLTAHGFLHLIGYDHMTAKDEAEMIDMQKMILNRVGIAR